MSQFEISVVFFYQIFLTYAESIGLLFGCCAGKAFFFSFSFLIWPAFIFTESHSSQLKGRKKARARHSWSWGTRSARLELGRPHLLSARPAPSRRGLSMPIRALLLASHCSSGDVPFREPLSGSDSSSLSTSGPGAGGRWSL